MFTIAIIEDEPLAAQELENLLTEVSIESKVIVKLSSVKEAIVWLSQNTVDLIISDIELGDGLSFEIFNTIGNKTPIVLTTAYDHYALRAFKEKSIDYLLKPIEKDELNAALDKYKNWSTTEKPYNINALLEALNPIQSRNYQERFMTTLGERIHSIKVDDIAYFYSEERYTYLVVKSGSKFIINDNLGEIEGNLNPSDFYRVNRKFIISYQSIVKMIAYSKSRVKIELDPTPPNHLEVVVSVERSGSFKKWLNR